MIDDDDRWGWKPDRVPLRHLQRYPCAKRKRLRRYIIGGTLLAE